MNKPVFDEWLTAYQAMAYADLQHGGKLYWAKLKMLEAKGQLEFRYVSGDVTRISKRSLDAYFGPKSEGQTSQTAAAE